MSPPPRAETDGGRAPQPGRIGPNAITRIAEALDHEIGPVGTRELFACCGLAHYLDVAPEHMVDEGEVAFLHATLSNALGSWRAGVVSRTAGLRTGDYLLAKRIPHAIQRILKVLPAPLASRMLLAAIGKKAWTFVGSGQFRAITGPAVRISIAGCPICRQLTAEFPRCEYFASTFERLYRELVHPDTEVQEIECEANGDAACVFEVRW